MKKGLLIGAFALSSVAALAQDAVASAIVGSEGEGKTWVVNVELTNATSFNAFSMDLKIPSSVKTTNDKCRITPRLQNDKVVSIKNESNVSTSYPATYKLEYNLSGSTLHIVGYSLGNEPIVGKSGDVIFQISLESTTGLTADAFATAKLENVKFVKTADLTAKSLADASVAWRKKGDVNKDGLVNTVDATMANNIYLGNVDHSVYGDVNNDGLVNTVDATTINNIYLGNTK